MYALGAYEAGGEPLLPKPISVGAQVRVQGEVSGDYLCQIKNAENRAFRELYQREHGEGVFAATGFSVQQRADLTWKHSVRGGAKSLTAYYDFVVVRQFEPPKALAAAAAAAAAAASE